MKTLLLVFAGSGAGGTLRFLISEAVQRLWTSGKPMIASFPMGTFTVNVTGCLAIGALIAAFRSWPVRDEIQIALIAGFLGGYTTFSAFSRETVQLVQEGRASTAVLYLLLSNAVGIAATIAGMKLIGTLMPATN